MSALVGQRLSLTAFEQLAGTLGGYRYVKVVVERPNETVHFLDSATWDMHVKYVAAEILGMPRPELERNLDAFNDSVYRDPERRFYLGTIALHERRFFSLETTEADTMGAEMIEHFHRVVREHVDPALPLLFKPANHEQEQAIAGIPAAALPRVLAHELYSMAQFVPLNPGVARGRLRVVRDGDVSKLDWRDIVVMDRVPEDVPRVAGFINGERTTPLSHTNILASGWGIPNAIQLDILDRIDGLDGQWVQYTVDANGSAVELVGIDEPELAAPSWRTNQITLSEPDIDPTPIVRLDQLTRGDHLRYGTKAANLGELNYVLAHGSERLLGFYQVPRPPRPNLLRHLAGLFGLSGEDGLSEVANGMLRKVVNVPRGIAVPFAVQRQFLESSPAIQQAIGKLKMALELDAPVTDALCLSVQQMIRTAPIPAHLQRRIEDAIGEHLGGVASFVVRSSSNAEDLAGFSAAGIYESVNHITSAASLFDGVRQVWASLLSPRAVRLRQQVGISLDDCYMGVVIQEEVSAALGGVLVTANPTNQSDFRNVYVNVSRGSVIDVVDGSTAPLQYLFSTVEGGGRTLSLGDAESDLVPADKELLQQLALAGRLLQSHFSPDYRYDQALDIEWMAGGDTVHILQVRPY